jgi:hypothetical protein
MKKLFSTILVLSLLLSGNAYAEEYKICTYEEILNKISPCDNGYILKKNLENPYLKFLKPENVSLKQFHLLINKRIKEWDAGASQRDKEYEEDRKKRIDLKCEILGGRANNSSSAKKIYKKCMKAEGY